MNHIQHVDRSPANILGSPTYLDDRIIKTFLDSRSDNYRTAIVELKSVVINMPEDVLNNAIRIDFRAISLVKIRADLLIVRDSATNSIDVAIKIHSIKRGCVKY